MITRNWRVFIIGTTLLVGATVSSRLKAADGPPKNRRLLKYYARIVDSDQRNEIYEIRAEYALLVDALERRIAQLKADENTKMEAVLDEEQLRQLQAFREKEKERATQIPPAAADETAGGAPVKDEESDKSPQREEVSSSALKSVGYREAEKILEIQFHSSGAVYRYYGVPLEVYAELINAESIGGYYNREIKGEYKIEKIEPVNDGTSASGDASEPKE